jgi:hypothetical protein
VRRLTRYPDEVVERALRCSSLLADALNFAAILNNPLADVPPEPRSTDAPAPVLQGRPRDDRALHKQIGPTQNYEDDF